MLINKSIIDKDNVIYGGPLATNLAQEYKSIGDLFFHKLRDLGDTVIFVSLK